MKIISKITNPLNHGKDLEDAQNAYNYKIENIKTKEGQLNISAQQLYALRKESLRSLIALESYVSGLEGCPNSIREGAKRALEYADAIREAWDFENAPHAVNAETGNAADASMMAAAVAGGATALGGSAAAMAIATTFGTASTGAAISSLGGAAAANAALAWLGGGTLAAGGAGISGGAALLGMFGPIGWGIAGVAGVALVVSSTFKKKKNDKAIQEIKQYSQACDDLLSKINQTINSIHEIHHRTEGLLVNIDISKFQRFVSNFNTDSYPHSLLFETVSDAKSLGKIMKQSVNIN